MFSIFISCLLFLVGLPLFTNANPFLCDNLLTIDPPANLNQTYFYPSGWNNSADPMQYASGQNCTWVINVPPGTFASFALKSQTAVNSSLTVTDSINQVTEIGDADMEPFYFNSPKFTIQLNAQTVGKLGFRLTWFKYPSFTPQNYQVTAQGDPLVFWTAQSASATVLTADTQVSLVGLTTAFTSYSFYYYLRATFIYDGPTWNSTFLGNLYDVVQSGKQLVSTGKQMTIFSIFPGFDIYAGFLIQDYSGVKDIVQYRSLVCDMTDFCNIDVQAVNGKSALVSAYNGPVYLLGANISSSANLKVYAGKINETNLITTYRRDVDGTNFPQKFPGYLTTYILDQDSGMLTLSLSITGTYWGTARDGRKGFFASYDYLKLTPKNNGYERIDGSPDENYQFSMNVKQSGIVGKATLQLIVYSSNGKNFYDQTFSKDKQVPNSLIMAQGTGIRVDYNTNGENTTGFMVEYAMTKMGGASLNYGLLVPLVLAIFSMIAF